MWKTQLDLVASIVLATVCAWVLGVLAGWLYRHAGLEGWVLGVMHLIVLTGLAVCAILFVLLIRDWVTGWRKRHGGNSHGD